MVSVPRFKERWTIEVPDTDLGRISTIGGCPTIGLFDAYAQKRAKERGLHLVATDNYEFSYRPWDMIYELIGDVLVEDRGESPEIEATYSVKERPFGVIPYIRQMEG